MYVGYIFSVCSSVLILMTVECIAVKDSEGPQYQNISIENDKVRPHVSSKYCEHKFSCDGNHTMSCYCDILCEIIGDCCEGFKTNRTIETFPDKSQYSCYRMPKVSVSNAFGALVVAACPTDWRDDESRSLCENGRQKVEIENTYVNDNEVVFKNVFCAFCNSVLPRAYSLLTLEICANGSLSEKLKNAKTCNYLYNKRAQKDSIRTCPLKVIRKCPVRTADDMSENCTSGEYRTVYDADGNMYRNIQCGLCNNISREDLSCEKDKVYVDEPYAFSKLFRNDEGKESFKITHSTKGNNSDISGRSGINTTELTVSGQDNAQKYVTVVALVISIVSLVITLVVYKSFPILMNTPGKITFCLALSLLLAQFLFLLSSETERIPWLCITMAVLVHYFFLAAFCWMNVIAFDLWMTFANHKFDSGDKRFYYYNVYAWLVPVVIVTIAVICNFAESVGTFSPGYGNNGCWLFSENAKLLFFIGPLALFKLFDIVAFSYTVYFIRKSKREASFAREGKGKTCIFLINVKLSLIMGLTWMFAFLARYGDNEVLWYIFTVFNALQGLFIFLCFVCTKQVFKLFRKSCRLADSANTNNAKVKSSKDTRSTSI